MGFTPYEARMMERAIDLNFGVDKPPALLFSRSSYDPEDDSWATEIGEI